MVTDILLVEDNPADASLLMELMSEYNNNIKIEWLTDGSLALDYVSQKKGNGDMPSMMVLDLSLPRVSGYEVLEKFKNELKISLPIIVLSTSSNPMDAKQCKELGAADYIAKPHDLEGYINMVKRLADVELPKFKA